jgi:hypothetical protein
VLESELEEAVFTDCNDYISIRDREGDSGGKKNNYLIP